MPMIRVEMFAGRTTEQKRELVEALTRETSRVVGCPPEAVWVVIRDVAKDDWGIAGQLCSDKYPD